ncbi:BRISC and BRCA1-A complex member 2 [Harpegnathos saltator]|uniref:BRISC and BRCA1-A complex member 2 n=1 Tax=Harpegnathos saltator TaxID=610380 RepID=E2C5S4_HARSA|nr:BRISC and BRCA1-A complex member 2 [Harpegnathos saltator]EFN76708.1 Protein BRE [Harpegnathos saltator]
MIDEYRQRYTLVNTIDPYTEPLLKRVLHSKRLGISYGGVKLNKGPTSCNKSSNDCYKLTIPYAYENLLWTVLFDSQYPEIGPDFIFNDQTFLMDPDIDILSTKVPSLVKWDPTDSDALLNVLVELLLYYKEHQIESLAQQGDRLQFEYSTLVGNTELHVDDIEVILLPLGGKPVEARFLIRISMDCCLPPCVDKLHDNETMLHITFYGPDWNRIIPKLYLSKTLEKAFGGPDSLHLPPFPPTTKYLMDYVPEVKKYIEEKINAVVECFEKRKDFLAALLMIQSCSLLEYDTKEFDYCTIMLEQLDFHVLVHFYLPPGFPKESPQITLYSVYHMTPQGAMYKEVLEDVPYSPRWSMHQMVIKCLTHIMDKAVPKFHKNSVKVNRY